MSEIASAYVSIFPKFTSTFGGDVKREVSASTKGVGEQLGKETTAGFRRGVSSASGMLQAAGGAIAVASIGAFVKSSVDSFSSLEDATGAASVVFGKSMTQIIEQSEDAAKTMGMTKAQVVDAANTFGMFGSSAGKSGDDLAAFSTEMTQLAADMASFKGTSPEQAIEAIGAAFRGEAEPIRAYGVMLDDASMKQAALKMGLVETTKEALTPQQKVLVAQKLILEQTSMAQGDFARTSQSTANVQKTLTAELENTRVEIGSRLAPIIKQAQLGMLGFLGAVNDNSAALVPLIQLTGSLAGAIGALFVAGKVRAGVSSFVGGVQSMQASIETFATSIQTKGGVATAGMMRLGNAVSAAGKALPIIGVASIAAGAAFVYFGAKAEESKARVEKLTDAIKADNGALGENYQKTLATSLQKQGLFEAGRKLGLGVEDVTLAHMGEADALARVQDAMSKVQFVTQGDSVVTTEATDARDKLNASLGDTASETAKAVQAARDTEIAVAAVGKASATTQTQVFNLGEEVKSVGSKWKDEADAIDKATKALWDNVNASLSALGGETAYYAAADNLTKVLQENGVQFDKNTGKLNLQSEKTRNSADAMRTFIGAGEGVIKTMIESGEPLSAVQAKLTEQRKKFLAAADAAGINDKKAAELWTTYGMAPDEVTTLIQQHGAEAAATAAVKFTERVNEIPKSRQAAFLAYVNQGQLRLAEAELNRAARNRTVRIDVTGSRALIGGRLATFASGGYISGPGTGTSDSIPAMLSNGEYVLRAASVAKLGLSRLDYLNRMGSLPRFAKGGQVARQYFAGGGAVGPSSPPAATSSAGPSLDAQARAFRAALDGASVELRNGRLWFQAEMAAQRGADLIAARAR